MAQKENLREKIRFSAPEPSSPEQMIHQSDQLAHMPGSADSEPTPRRGCRWLSHVGSACEVPHVRGLPNTYTSPLFHVCFFSCFLVPSEKRGKKRECPQIKFIFLLFQTLRKPLLHTYICQGLSLINSIRRSRESEQPSLPALLQSSALRERSKTTRSNAGKQPDRTESLGLFSVF